jgi:Fe-S cluster biogenesis protein NfuA
VSTTTDDKDLLERFQRIEALLAEVEQRADPAVLSAVQEIVQSLLDYHGAALTRIVETIGPDLASGLAEDDLVSSLLVLHNLHPQDLETRVQRALESVRPQLRGHGGNVELLGITAGSVRLRLIGSCHSCPSSTQTLRQLIQDAIYAFAPDATGLEVESDEPPTRGSETFIPVEQLMQVRANGHSREG